ncbi:MAG: oligopeptide transporter, OPT family [candidate division Zixibacteria bacterium]|nr:oligopeptide transporter, OPT family [candidate division Zixibacteria bacterium]
MADKADANVPTTGAKKFQPYIKAEQVIPEATLKAMVLGCIIAMIFAVANAYLGLKFGMTVSASIPAAVISMGVLRGIYGKTGVTVLENNIVQTIGSAGESLAAGVIFTLPAFFIWAANSEMVAAGYKYDMTKMQIFWFALLGGTLGVLLMIPLRKYLVEKEHNNLRFPEGTACAEIIIAGDEGGSRAKMIFMSMGVGAAYKAFMSLGRFWSESPSYDFKGLMKGGVIGMDATPALLGVGYIIGPKVAALMMAGAVIGYLGFSPLLAFIGNQIPGLIIAPGTIPLSEMDSAALRNSYIKYLGVGAVAFGGFISLIKSLPAIIGSFGTGISQLLHRKGSSGQVVPRTDRDLPMIVVIVGTLLVALGMWLLPGTNLNLLATILAVIFGFFFVVVAARIVGIVGSSSSPVSGMTVFTLLVTSLILLYFGYTGVEGMVSAMSVGAVVCIAVCLSGTISQDLKTGYLLGATPKTQQLTVLLGVLFPALIIGSTFFLLNDAFGFVRTAQHLTPLEAPQANVMATIVQGVIGGNIPWTPILVGAMIGLAVELLGASSLPFAIGMYLPLSLSTPIMLGGLVAYLIRKTTKDENLYKKREESGILFGSGLVASDALIGVLSAGMIAGIPAYYEYYTRYSTAPNITGAFFGPIVSIALFFGLALMFYLMTRSTTEK